MTNPGIKKNKSAIGLVLAAVVVVGAGAVAYTQGWIPGVGAGGKAAKELKAKVESLKGPNIEGQIVKYFSEQNSFTKYMGEKERAKFKDQLTSAFQNDIDLSLDYAGLDTSSGEGKGTVTINSPKLSFKDLKASQDGYLTVPKFVLSREADDANHYYFHSEGDLEAYVNMGGTMTKIGSISAEEPYNEIKFNDAGELTYSKSSAKNVKMIEGRGNTIVASIEKVDSESSLTVDANKQLDTWAKIKYTNIMPGDMIKLMLGNIEPISINMDYAYKGDDFYGELNKFIENAQKRNQEVFGEVGKSLEDPNYKPQTSTSEPAEFKVNGDLKVNDVSILMGGAGVQANAALKFSKESKELYPIGDATVRLAQYQKLIDYAKKFFPVSPEETEKGIKFLSEIGDNANGDITFQIKFDGTEKVLVGGKTEEEVNAIKEKYYPAVSLDTTAPAVEGSAGPEPVTPSVPAEVETKALPAN